MDIVSQITQWIYPLIELAVVICCFIYIKHKIGMLLGIAFSLMLLSSLTWRLASYINGLYDFDLTSIYEVLGYVNLIIYLVSSGLIIVAIIKIGELVTSNSAPAGQSGTQSILPPASGKPLGSVLLYMLPAAIGAIVVVIGIVILADRHGEDEGLFVVMLGLMVVLYSSIYFLVVLYRLWHFIIQTSKAEGLTPSIESPGKAVGFLFIPLFSYYWAFIAFGKLPKDLNAIANQRGFSNGISDSMGILVAVFSVISVIPILGYITGAILMFVLVPIFLSQSIRLVAALQGAGSKRSDGSSLGGSNVGENELEGC